PVPRREWYALRPCSGRDRDCSRAADHGCGRARTRRAVGHGRSAALPRRRHGDRRNASTRQSIGWRPDGSHSRPPPATRSASFCAPRRTMGLPLPPRAGSSARRRPSMLSAVTASVRRGSSCVSCATAVVISEHGSWSGTVWSSVSSSQRILSLWLDRLSTDRIAQQWREAPSPLIVFGKRGNLDLLLAVDAAAERLGLAPGLALAQARAMHPTLKAVPEDQ